MKNNLEATILFEKQLNKIHFIHCYFRSNHGINMYFTLNTNQLDLSKNHPDEIYFYNKEGNYLMDYIKKRNEFCLSYIKIWTKLEEEFGLKEQEITDLTKSVLEEHFKCTLYAVRLFLLPLL